VNAAAPVIAPVVDDRRRSFAFSSEYPVERWFGTEILDHSPKSVRMGFMNSGRAPLLMHHDRQQVVGVIENASINADRVGRGVARFGRSANAEAAKQDADDGILVNTSVGYRVHELTLEKQSDAGDTYRVTDWEPMECSMCGIPADPSVGMGRAPEALAEQPKPAADAEAPAAIPVPQVLQQPATTADRSSEAMTETTVAGGGARQARAQNVTAAVKRRRSVGTPSSRSAKRTRSIRASNIVGSTKGSR
jgi:hypothetical protein